LIDVEVIWNQDGWDAAFDKAYRPGMDALRLYRELERITLERRRNENH